MTDYRLQTRQPVTWPEMVKDPVGGGMRILTNQIADRDAFIESKGLTAEFQEWLRSTE